MNEYWYCENCTEEVDSSCVTFQELHDRCGHPVNWIVPKDKPEIIDIPVIAGTFPVVLYLCSEDDQEELIQAMMEIHPNMRSRKL